MEEQIISLKVEEKHDAPWTLVAIPPSFAGNFAQEYVQMPRRTVFILRAGASKEGGAPLMGEFLDVADEVRESREAAAVRSEFDLVFKALDELKPVLAMSKIDLNNIESVFAAFEMAKLFGRLGAMSGADIDGVLYAIRVVIAHTIETGIRFGVSEGRIEPPRPYEAFTDLVREMTKAGSTVSIFTFNYDLALDYAMGFNSLPFDYGLEGSPQGKTAVLKLHGSFNFGRCAACNAIFPINFNQFVGRLRSHMGSSQLRIPFVEKLGEFNHGKCGGGLCGGQCRKDPVVIPPTWNKTHHYAEIANVWRLAAENLSEAENIVVIGYSLPETDHFFQYLYALGTVGSARLKRFWVINPSEDVAAKFRRFLGPLAIERLRHFAMTFSEAIGTLRQEFLKEGRAE